MKQGIEMRSEAPAEPSLLAEKLPELKQLSPVFEHETGAREMIVARGVYRSGSVKNTEGRLTIETTPSGSFKLTLYEGEITFHDMEEVAADADLVQEVEQFAGHKLIF